MRSTQLITGALAVAATSALIGLGAAPGNAQLSADQTPDPTTPGVTHESGKLLECTGDAGTTPVRANLYQNRTYGNHLEVLVDDGTPGEAGVSRKAATPFVVGHQVRATARISGKRVTISGTAQADRRGQARPRDRRGRRPAHRLEGHAPAARAGPHRQVRRPDRPAQL